jgi:hypothetical protein
MLIAGCSHAAGSEIDGTDDSPYNRQHSFGNLLAQKMDFEPINIADNGATNPTILRTILEWISENYDPTTMELFVLVPWTESSRMEFPWDDKIGYKDSYADWISKYRYYYKYINQGYAGGNEEERKKMPYYQKFIADHLAYLEILSANTILQLQYFLKMKKINYLMCNTMHMLDWRYKHLDFHIKQIDRTKYRELLDADKAFFWKYRHAGYENPKAKYWHHNEEPHRLFADELYTFIKDNHVYS